VLEDGAQVGNYVEVKASRIGKRTKAKHLAYIGDARLGAGVNVGAGTVVVNYDGYEKHPTVIGDGARIGSDTMLVAPLKVGKGAVTGAGSVITKDVPAGALAVERSDQKNVKGYRKRADEKHGPKGKR
jgi:bifunctional UDP-N-acetylglucosamine pyrophosphorylase/glucosamine-1-phosphate N-acetyltransferase